MALFSKDHSEEKKTSTGKKFTKADVLDLWNEDSYLRTQLADRIQKVVHDMEHCREILTKKMELGSLKDIGVLIGSMTALEEKIRHAEQGYTGISADYRIQYETLKQLYEWDRKLTKHIDDLKQSVTQFQNMIHSGNMEMMKQELPTIRGKVRQFIDIVEKRRDAVPGLEVK